MLVSPLLREQQKFCGWVVAQRDKEEGRRPSIYFLPDLRKNKGRSVRIRGPCRVLRFVAARTPERQIVTLRVRIIEILREFG